jgi:hypothetical protein
MRSALFWDIIQRIVLIPYDVSGQTMGLIFKLQKYWEFLSLEYGTNRLSRKVGKESPPYAAQYPRRAQISDLR